MMSSCGSESFEFGKEASQIMSLRAAWQARLLSADGSAGTQEAGSKDSRKHTS